MMFKAIIMMATIVVAGLFASEVSAQQRIIVGINAGFGDYYYQNPYCVNPHWGYGFYNGGATVQGDWLRGQAMYMQSYGAYLQQRAAAAAAYEEARRRYLENQMLYLEIQRQLQADLAAKKAAEKAERDAKRQALLDKKKKD